MKVGDKTRNYCVECYKQTNHNVLFIKKIDGSDDYRQSNFYLMVECGGCGEISYRTEYHDYEQMVEDDHGNWTEEVTILTYPEVLENHRRLDDIYHLPKDIQIVYKEALKAFSSKCYLLTAIAFRTIIEAICLNKSINVGKVDGDDLSAKIDKLVTNRLITQRESERLHAIRFKGNDSVHEMAVPKPGQLMVVLDVIEHLLKNLYIIDQELNGSLDTVIRDFSELKQLLNKHIAKLEIGQSLPLGKILGKSSRQLSSKANELEEELQKKIKKGEYKKLELGEVVPHADPKRPNVQHYIIKDLEYDY